MKNFNEKALVQKLDKILKKEFGTNLSFREFSAGYGIADLVFATDFSFSKEKIRKTPIANFNGLKILFSLEDGEIYSREEILKLGHALEGPALIKQLNSLIKNNYIERVSRNSYKKIISNENPIQKIVAIEVKLSDHKNGFIQAKRYKYFADESYLAILKEAEKNIDFSEFDKQNIGLILFDSQTGTIEIKYPQKASCFESRINLFAKELMLTKFLEQAS